MLTLTRGVHEQILISGDITITICEIRHGKVRVGIDAPPEVGIVRAELGIDALREFERRHRDEDDE